MAEWTNWFILMGVLLILEIFTGTFYLLMIAIGFGAGGIAAWLGLSLGPQLILAGIVGVIATLVLRRGKLGNSGSDHPARDGNVNLDIGQHIMINDWNTGGLRSSARVLYRGAMWDVELAPGLSAEPGAHVITEIRGSHLIVSKP